MMRAAGDSFLEGKIQILVEGREEVEVACKKLVREEAAALREGRRFLYYCYSLYNVIVALQDLEEMTGELLGYSGQLLPRYTS